MTSPPATDPGTGWARLRARLDNPQTWIAIFSIFTVALVALVDTDRTSPGPVSAVHATVEELEGGTNCAACHGGLFGDQDSSCLDCHAVIAEQLEGGTGLHGTIAEDRRSSCAVCHSEHHGLAFSPVNRASFAAAGLGDRDGLDHEPFGFAMEGAHLELDCAACHVNADIEVLPAGETRFLGLDASCVSCHEDAHEGALGSSCADCHDQADFAAPRSADHSRVLDLVGPHAGIDCRSCHGEGEAHSLEALASEASPPAGRRCADCHESPHDPNFLSGVARAV
ncbi:MAG TPA: hypothetical protein ENJ09_00735, partial [Planctomycetes bacterium]|nr:hypothetical protein [Planctomycetota bacterium]